jgi:hypothetical protein
VTAGMHSPLEQQVLLVESTCYKVLIINGVNLCRQHMYEVGLKTNYSNVDNHSCLMGRIKVSFLEADYERVVLLEQSL